MVVDRNLARKEADDLDFSNHARRKEGSSGGGRDMDFKDKNGKDEAEVDVLKSWRDGNELLYNNRNQNRISVPAIRATTKFQGPTRIRNSVRSVI